jgi:hypothetical protein
MSTPLKNPRGYESSSIMTHVQEMKGKLMLIHGLIDENVHFRHTARLINSLIKYRKRYELILFPNERHSPHNIHDRIYIEDIIHDFFSQHLQPSLSSTLLLTQSSTASTPTPAITVISETNHNNNNNEGDDNNGNISSNMNTSNDSQIAAQPLPHTLPSKL